jgi:ATP-dependent DNA ligase
MKARDLRRRINWAAAESLKFVDIEEFFTSEWIIEPKLDGCRVRMIFGATSNAIWSSVDRSTNFPHFRDAIVLEDSQTILDGELLAPGPVIRTHTGNWTDSLLNASVALTNSNPVGSVETQERFGKAKFHAFDILAYRRTSVIEMPYIERRKLLVDVVLRLCARHPDCQVTVVPQHVSRETSITRSLAAGHEGVVFKRLQGPYEPGKRSKHWYKAKRFNSADAFICGYSPGTKGNSGKVGSLEVAVMCVDGSVRPVARVGNLDGAFRTAISASDGSLKKVWYGAVIEFSAQGLTKSGRARSASMIRVRPDRTSESCLEDQLHGFPSV